MLRSADCLKVFLNSVSHISSKEVSFQVKLTSNFIKMDHFVSSWKEGLTDRHRTSLSELSKDIQGFAVTYIDESLSKVRST